jgi:AcrR family transcriptional regulator
MRCDGVHNRMQLIQVATEVFANQGLNAPLESIADQAGVGIGTLYRHFRNRDELIMVVYSEWVDRELLGAAESGLANADAWEGFRNFIYHICEMQARDPGLNDMFCITSPTISALESNRAAVYTKVTQMIERAQTQGVLRSDLLTRDVLYIILGNAAIVEATRDTAPEAWKRFVALMLEGFRADKNQPLPEPVSREILGEALRNMRPSKLRNSKSQRKNNSTGKDVRSKIHKL